MNDIEVRIKIYDFIKGQINPYGKPFEGTTYELGTKIMDYIASMDEQAEWYRKQGLDGRDWYMCSKCSVMVNKMKPICPVCGADMRGEKHEINRCR